MEKVVRTLVLVIIAVCVTWAYSESAVWQRGKDGRVHVSVADISGVHNVTVTVEGDDGQQATVFIPHLSAVDKTWRAVIPDITKNDVIHYIIEYQLADSLHRVTGSHSFKTTEQEVSLSSELYLRRRTTTVFYDDFSSGRIDPNKWTHDIMASGLGHFLIYSPESANSYVKNGILYIKPTLTTDRFGSNIMQHGTIDARQLWGDCRPNWGGDTCVTHAPNNRPIMSASLNSRAHIKYGMVEVVAKLPKGDWIWPAIWMMPTESHYGGWPKSGEIDIMEAAGNLHLRHPNGHSVGANVDHVHIHYGTGRDGAQHAQQGTTYQLPHGYFSDDFHTFWLDWSSDHIRIGVDNHRVIEINTPQESFWNQAHLQGNNIWAHGGKNAPFDRPFYLILNVAVGDGFFWSGYINEPYPRPWTADGPPQDFQQFWAGRNHWLPTWHGEDTALKIKSVRMQQY